MCLSPTLDRPSWLGRAACHIYDEAREQVAQVEAAVEAIGEGSEVALGMLGPGQRVEGAVQRCLEIAQDRVEPLEQGQVWFGPEVERALYETILRHRLTRGSL
jgi:hypothetical protein